ncbi:hypothetical protein IFM89_022121 [Coptis chinensis]|uniref:Uncharacterized protein n=1 Tax=Coptis chinensis TaxID=261450 RepID=A0A835HMQ8_9MAGN|nr:hypothetical protein IFM89_022121 [Coptis chinensis]
MFAIRMNLGDPDFINEANYVSDMLSPSFAKELREKIFDNTTFPSEYYMSRLRQKTEDIQNYFHGEEEASRRDRRESGSKKELEMARNKIKELQRYQDSTFSVVLHSFGSSSHGHQLRNGTGATQR